MYPLVVGVINKGLTPSPVEYPGSSCPIIYCVARIGASKQIHFNLSSCFVPFCHMLSPISNGRCPYIVSKCVPLSTFHSDFLLSNYCLVSSLLRSYFSFSASSSPATRSPVTPPFSSNPLTILSIPSSA